MEVCHVWVGGTSYIVDGIGFMSAISLPVSLATTGLLPMVAGFSLDTYIQMVYHSIARYETPPLHTAIEMLSGKPG